MFIFIAGSFGYASCLLSLLGLSFILYVVIETFIYSFIHTFLHHVHLHSRLFCSFIVFIITMAFLTIMFIIIVGTFLYSSRSSSLSGHLSIHHVHLQYMVDSFVYSSRSLSLSGLSFIHHVHLGSFSYSSCSSVIFGTFRLSIMFFNQSFPFHWAAHGPHPPPPPPPLPPV